MVALVGNPNTGKTALFNALTGMKRQVAHYPGVTVDVGRGAVRGARRPTELLDLPGTYSLIAASPDELVTATALRGDGDFATRPNVILSIVDASNLRRNLYLVSQLLEVGLPVVIALNMVDVARSRGIGVDADKLSARLGVPVVPTVATDRKTVTPLIEVLGAASDGPPPAVRSAHRDRPADSSPDQAAAEVRERYAWIDQTLQDVIARPERRLITWSDRVDRVLTHRLLGAAALLVVLFIVFQSIFSLAGPVMDGVEAAFGWLGAVVGHALPAGAWRSAVVDGLIGGVGGVLVFLPQIAILFAAISVLEDCGYMARAAFMVDRLMHAVGLSGRSFIPLLSAFACAVPAIMGTRTISDRRERFVTILIAPFMTCSARLPVYVLMIAAFVPATKYLGGWVGLQGLVMLAMYLVGIIAAVPIAWLLRKTAFAGPPPSFILELPSYKWPRLGAIWQRVYLSGCSFVCRAGTVILVVNLVVWALGYFPRSNETRTTITQKAQAAGWDEHRTEAELAGAYLSDSYLGRMGRAIEPVIKPIGWDWRVGVAVIASFPAREVVVATLGTILHLGEDETDEPETLRQALRQMRWKGSDRRVFTLPTALSVMVFFALCAQCSATLVVIGREMHSWLWPVLSFLGMTTIAYFAAWGTSALASALSAAGG